MKVNSRKVAVIGCGFVGSSSAFALMQSGLFSEMVLIDADTKRAEGEAMDISHGISFARPMQIYAGNYDDITDAAIIVITAGANQKPDETRLDLIKKNAAIMKSIVGEIKKRDFVDAAIVSGGSSAHILWVHILPNILPLMVITAAADIGAMMMELAGLSFLGFGSQPPAPEWGLMLNEGRQQLQTAPWLMIFPGLAIFITVVVFNLWGDSLRDVLDPRQD